jgi:hypothetical protein
MVAGVKVVKPADGSRVIYRQDRKTLMPISPICTNSTHAIRAIRVSGVEFNHEPAATGAGTAGEYR